MAHAFCPPGEDYSGVYLWGAAGRGKTMLMDLFLAPLQRTANRGCIFTSSWPVCMPSFTNGEKNLRNGALKGDDPIPAAADSIARRTWVLCGDEFSVTDIADAMILGRLFFALFARGLVIVATSNVRPDLLYQDGLDRTLFLLFIAMIEAKMEVVRLNARADFRLEKLGDQPV